MGRKPDKIEPYHCDHLIERLRHGRRRFHADHVPTLMTWLYMNWLHFDTLLNTLSESSADPDSEHSRRYRKWVHGVRDVLSYLMEQVKESWGGKEWDDCVSKLWHEAGAIPQPEPVQPQVLADDGNPNAD